jgi:hypothetical protein
VPIQRGAAALGVSLAFHLAVIFLGGAFPFGALVDTIGGDLLIVEVVAADATVAPRAVAASPAARPSRTAAAPVALPPVLPLTGEEVSPPPEPHAELSPSAEPHPEVSPSAEPHAVAEMVSPSTAVAPPSNIGPEASQDANSVPAIAESSAAPSAANGIAQSTDPAANADLIAGRAASDDEPKAAPDQAIAGDDPAGQAADRRVSLSRLDAVTRNPSVSARTAGEPFVGRRDVFEFLLDHPDFATHITRALRLARYRMWRTDEGLFVDDGWGATGQVFVVHATSGTRVLYAKGEFQHKLLPPIPGEAVVTINYDAQPTSDGRDRLVADISSQLKIDGPFGTLVVKLASSLATEKAEKESQRLMRLFARVLRAIEERPAALYASLLERPDVPQRELEQFRILLKLP